MAPFKAKAPEVDRYSQSLHRRFWAWHIMTLSSTPNIISRSMVQRWGKMLPQPVQIYTNALNYQQCTTGFWTKYLHLDSLRGIYVYIIKGFKFPFKLHKSSFHPKHTFQGRVKSQLIWFHRICSFSGDMEEATQVLYRTLGSRGYTGQFLREIKRFKILLPSLHHQWRDVGCPGQVLRDMDSQILVAGHSFHQSPIDLKWSVLSDVRATGG